MANVLTDPPFAADPPVKFNVNAKILGLVLGILAILGGLLFGLLPLLASFGACTILGTTIGGCGIPILWLLGALVLLVGYVLGAIGGFRMYQMNREGKLNVIYGLSLGAVGTVLYLIGNIIFYSGITVIGAGYGGAIVGVIIDLIVIFILYYLVVISRFPGEAPLVPSAYGGGYGGYGSPPPPPPPV